MSRLLDEVPKTGEGRDTRRSSGVPRVEDLPCPRWGGMTPHVLVNTAAGGTLCEGCRVSWADLDSVARNTVQR